MGAKTKYDHISQQWSPKCVNIIITVFPQHVNVVHVTLEMFLWQQEFRGSDMLFKGE